LKPGSARDIVDEIRECVRGEREWFVRDEEMKR
jgi:hypothetical protein